MLIERSLSSLTNLGWHLFLGTHHLEQLGAADLDVMVLRILYGRS